MKRLIVLSVSTVMLLVLATGVHAQDLLVPAGTLLQCTLNEPNFSSATASVGDPVLCHLRSFQEFGHTAFPRGSMLGGHLEEAKDPGHFVGKGYMKITFDRVIVPTGDIPLPAKVISATGSSASRYRPSGATAAALPLSGPAAARVPAAVALSRRTAAESSTRRPVPGP